MILECPACQNRYLVDPRAIGTEGRTVRCAKCRHLWHALPQETAEQVEERLEGVVPVEEAAPQQAAAEPLPKKSSMVVVPQSRSNTPLSLKIATLAASILLMLTVALLMRDAITRNVPATGALYAALKLAPTEGVVLADMTYDKQQEGLKDRHVFSGFLVNTTQEMREIPSLQVRLLGEDQRLIRQRRYSEKGTLAPGEEKRFEGHLDTSPESVSEFIMELGNSLELKLRP